MTNLPPRELQASAPESPKRPRDPWAIGMGIMGGVLLGTGLTFALLGAVGIFEEPTPPTIPPAPTLTVPPPSETPPTFGDVVSSADVASRVIPSTVAVEVSSLLVGGSGSGVVFGTDGYVITNHHVVDGASQVFVVFSDGARFPAEVVGTDPVTDIAVLLVDRTDLTSISVGSVDSIRIGAPAVAVGNPLGLAGGPSVSSGIVSAVDRTLDVQGGEALYGLVQTDAPIAPGSSGGALVDSGGRLIGITTAIAVSNVGPEGLGFAVPVDIVIGVASDLIETGEVRHALLGIRGNTAWAEADGAEYPVGVAIDSISANSAYEMGGGQISDVIVEIDGIEVKTLDSLLGRLRRLREGDVADIRILRAEDEATLNVTMGLLNP